MNQKTAKRLHKFAAQRETQPSRIEKFYNNAKRKFLRSNIKVKTLMNEMLDRELS